MTEEVKQPVTMNDKEQVRITNLQKGTPSAFTAQITTTLKKLAPLVGTFLKVLNTVLPIVERGVAMMMAVYAFLPMDIIRAIFGLALCFFGGTFAVSIAAFEAFMMTGYEDTQIAFLYLYSEFKKVKNAYIDDDEKDEDGDGIADVKQISTNELLTRKTLLFFSAVEDPQAVSNAWAGVMSGFMAVLATLKIEFAKVITLGVAIGNTLRKPLSYVMAPVLGSLLGEKYAKWTNVIINTTAKLIAVTIAWYIQKVVSAVHSGIKGGLMFSRNIIAFLNHKGYLNLDHESTYIDEVVGWALAVMGVWFQLSNFFSLPFPWNIILFPLTLLEWVLIWLIS